MGTLVRREFKVFYCYAREDKVLCEELEKHLKPLTRQYNLINWHDREILPGEDWAESIDQHLNTADIILLLISPDFMVSDYCHGKEMQRALERHRLGVSHVVPILLRSTYWENALFARLQMLPPDARPVSLWPDRDEAFHTIVKGISAIIKAIMVQDKGRGTERIASSTRQSGEISSAVLVSHREKTDATVIDLCIEMAKALGAYDHSVSLADLRREYLRAYPDIKKGKPQGSLEAEINFHTINMQSRFHYPQNKRKPDVWLSRPVFKRVAPKLYMLLSDEEISWFRQLLKEDDERIYQSEYNVDELFPPPSQKLLEESSEE